MSLIDGADLLRKLGSGVRPGSAPRAQGPPSLDSAQFETLLRAAERGELSSGAPVVIAPGAGVELSPEQFKRLARATDAAQAAGAQNLLAIIDGRAVTIGVAQRVVTGELSAGEGEVTSASVLKGIDAAVALPDVADEGADVDGRFRGVSPLQSVDNPWAATLVAGLVGGLGERQLR